MRYITVVLIVILLFVSCGKVAVETEFDFTVDWRDIQIGLMLSAFGQWDTGRTDQFDYYINNLSMLTNRILTAEDRVGLYDSIDLVGNAIPDNSYASLLSTVEETFDTLKDKIIETIDHKTDMLDTSRLQDRMSVIMNKLRVKKGFKNIIIQIDPSLSPGLTRAVVKGSEAKLFLHPQITYESFEQAFIVALLESVADREEFNLEQIDKLTNRYGGALSGWEQFLSDFSYSLHLWCGTSLEPDMMTYLVYSSVEFNHIFSAQLSHWAGNYIQFKDMNLTELVPYGFEDASNPIYERLLTRLVNPARLGITLDSGRIDSLEISGFASGSPASKSGLMIGDIIYKMDTEHIGSRWMLKRKLYDKDPNSYVILKVKRSKDLPTDGATSVIPLEDDPQYNIVSFQFLMSSMENLPEGVY
jgi:hypothetical protein